MTVGDAFGKLGRILEVGSMSDEKAIIPTEVIEGRILMVRGHKVMLDAHLAELYGVDTKMLKRAVRRNRDRFPADFMFELKPEEHAALRYQFGTLKRGEHMKYAPFVFTEQGVAMLSSILRSKRAVSAPESPRKEIGFHIMEDAVRYRIRRIRRN